MFKSISDKCLLKFLNTIGIFMIISKYTNSIYTNTIRDTHLLNFNICGIYLLSLCKFKYEFLKNRFFLPNFEIMNSFIDY